MCVEWMKNMNVDERDECGWSIWVWVKYMGVKRFINVNKKKSVLRFIQKSEGRK